MSVLAVPSENDVYEALRNEISDEPQPVSVVLQNVLGRCHVDREEVVAAMWDLVEDDGLIYDATAKIRRRI